MNCQRALENMHLNMLYSNKILRNDNGYHP